MTLKELKAIVDLAMQGNIGKGPDNVVCIRSDEPGIPTHPMIGVKTASLGFDWTYGRFIIEPEEAMVRKPKKGQK